MSINGTVTLAISELDELRNQIEQGKDKQQELKLEIADLKEKQKKVLVNLKVNETYKDTEQDRRRLLVNSREEEALLRNGIDASGRLTFVSGDYYDNVYGMTSYPKMLEVIGYKEVVKNRMHEKIEYIGFEDVTVDLQLRAEREVADKITTLTNELNNLRNKNSTLESQCFEDKNNIHLANTKAVDLLVSAHRTKTEELIKNYDTQVKTLSDEIKTLKNQEIEKTKDNLIADLQKKVEELSKQKSWFSRTFG